jgi:hypothetical protein
MTREQIISDAVFVALGCTKIDMRRFNSARNGAAQIARFVEDALSRTAQAPKSDLPAIME